MKLKEGDEHTVTSWPLSLISHEIPTYLRNTVKKLRIAGRINER